MYIGFPDCTPDKESACQILASAGRCKRHSFSPWIGKIPWSRKWQLAPVFLPGKFHGQSGLVSYSPRGHKESDTTEHKTRKSYSEVRMDKLPIHVVPQIISQTF